MIEKKDELDRDEIYKILKELNENEMNEVSAILKRIPGAQAALKKLGIESDPYALAKFVGKTIGDIKGFSFSKLKELGTRMITGLKAIEAGAWVYFGTPLGMSEEGKKLCDNIQKHGYDKWKEEIITSTDKLASNVDKVYGLLEADDEFAKLINFLKNEIVGDVKSGAEAPDEREGEDEAPEEPTEGEGEPPTEEEGEEGEEETAAEPEVVRAVRNILEPGQVSQITTGRQKDKWAAKPQSGGRVRYFVTKQGAETHALREDITKTNILIEEIDRILLELNGTSNNKTKLNEILKHQGLWCYRKYIKPDPEAEDIIKRVILANIERRVALHPDGKHPFAYLILKNGFIVVDKKWQMKSGDAYNDVAPGEIETITGLNATWFNHSKNRRALNQVRNQGADGLKLDTDPSFQYPTKDEIITAPDDALVVLQRGAIMINEGIVSNKFIDDFITRTSNFVDEVNKLDNEIKTALKNGVDELENKIQDKTPNTRKLFNLFDRLPGSTMPEPPMGEPENVEESTNYKILNNNNYIELQLENLEYIFEKQDFIRISNVNNVYVNKFLFEFNNDKITHTFFENNSLKLVSNDWIYLAKI